MRLVLALLLWLVALPAYAQLAINPQPPVCLPANGCFLGWTGSAWATGTLPTSTGGGITLTAPAGSGLAVTGCPACVITLNLPPSREAVGRAVTNADNWKLLLYTGATPATFTLPAVTASNAPTAVCFKPIGTGSLTISAASPIIGGRLVLDKPDDECLTPDGAGNWVISGVGASTAIANPNPVQ